MGKFDNMKSAKIFEDTKKAEAEKAQVVVVQNIFNENLIDNPHNGEDITRTDDLEESMKQNGFTDPMEVTDYGMSDGKYMILSGHRRRAAGVKVFGASFAFPCIVRHFADDAEVQNYTLMANSQRDSAKDPCLFCTRYKLHEQYLESIGFKGSKREEIAKRLGISIQQADRYNTMNKIILPVWDMVRAEQVGMSSVMPMAPHTEAEQLEIYNIMQQALRKDVNLTRDLVKKIVEEYKNGKKTWAEIADLPRDSGIPMNAFMNTDPGTTRDPAEHDRNSEVRREYDPIAAEYDAMDADKAEWERQQAENATAVTPEEEDAPDESEVDDEPKAKKDLSPEEKKLKTGNEISKLLHKLDTDLNNVWDCKDSEMAREMMIDMASLTSIMIDEVYRLGQHWQMSDEYKDALRKIASAVEQYN